MPASLSPVVVFASYFRDVRRRLLRSSHPAAFRDAIVLSALRACAKRYGAEAGSVGAAPYFLLFRLDPRSPRPVSA